MEKIVPCKDLRCVKVLVDEEKVKSLKIVEKIHLICSPKPTPNLCITLINTSRRRQFNRSVYKILWIAGCSHTNKLYCWPCIFFATEKSIWSTSGFNDLSKLSGSLKKHANTRKHLRAVLSFSNFRKKKQTKISLSPRLSDEISKYNCRVESNRCLFQRLVDIVSHLVQQEIPFKSNNESNASFNNSHFLELVSLLSRYDVFLQNHIQQQQNNKRDLTYLSDKIQENIIHSIADVIRNRIDFEIRQTKFISIIIEETQDISDGELCLILRYHFGNKIHDRLFCFMHVSKNHTAEMLFNVIFELLNKYECIPKLVAQSYDSASVISGIRNEVQQKVKDVCPQALYTWCNAHDLASVLSKSCNGIEEVSSFFSALWALCNFFNFGNTKRITLYDTYCICKKFPNMQRNVGSRWIYMLQVINTCFEQKIQFIMLFSDLCDNPQDWDGNTILAAENFDNTLRSFNFNFFLLVFHRIFEKTNNLYNIMQEKQNDVGYCSKEIKKFQSWMVDEFQFDFDQIYEHTLQNSSAPCLRARGNLICPHAEYKKIFVQVINNICSIIDDRYLEIDKLEFFQLLDRNCFNKYYSEFPTKALDSLLKTYSNCFEEQNLKNQLIVLYSSPKLRDCNVNELIDFINEYHLKDAFPELLKLAHLIVTIPATSSSEEHAFSSLKHIHTYLSNTQGQKHFSDLAMIAIEKQLLVELKCLPTFYSDVIKSFLKRDGQFDLEYKN